MSDRLDRHHLLEIILWPNPDGTFREIRNSKNRLKELGIYDDYKLCIEIPSDEHARLHHKGKISKNRGKVASKFGMEFFRKYGKTYSEDPELYMIEHRKWRRYNKI